MPPPIGFEIYQSCNHCESYIEDLESGGTGYVLSVEIFNRSDRVIWPCAYRFRPLSNERDFRWLGLIAWTGVEFPYRFPGETSGGFGPDRS